MQLLTIVTIVSSLPYHIATVSATFHVVLPVIRVLFLQTFLWFPSIFGLYTRIKVMNSLSSCVIVTFEGIFCATNWYIAYRSEYDEKLLYSQHSAYGNNSYYEGESVNRSQMDIKRKTCDIRNWKKHLYFDIYSTNNDTIVPSLYQCVETRSIEVFWLLSQPLPHLRFNLFVLEKISRPSRYRLMRHTLPTVNMKHLFMNILCIGSFFPQKKNNRTLLFGSILNHGRQFDYWNQPLNIRMRICYLDCHEGGLCWYLVIHIYVENLLRPLRLFYCHLWPIYWLYHVLWGLGANASAGYTKYNMTAHYKLQYWNGFLLETDICLHHYK
jgi:hypothetical protein